MKKNGGQKSRETVSLRKDQKILLLLLTLNIQYTVTKHIYIPGTLQNVL
jgi:hypothetical protein